jgi:hypothetical protein
MDRNRFVGDGNPDDQISPEVTRKVKDKLNPVDREVDWSVGSEVRKDLQENPEDDKGSPDSPE